jgi:phage baseplate assembly protein W
MTRSEHGGTGRTGGALLFHHPDLGGRGPTTGLTTDPAGRLAVAPLEEAVYQSLLLLLSTDPGERVMRPGYGCPLQRLAFQPLDNTTAGLAIHYVETAVRRWEPRAEIVRVDAAPVPGRLGTLGIELHYRVSSTTDEQQLHLELVLDQGAY